MRPGAVDGRGHGRGAGKKAAAEAAPSSAEAAADGPARGPQVGGGDGGRGGGSARLHSARRAGGRPAERDRHHQGQGLPRGPGQRLVCGDRARRQSRPGEGQGARDRRGRGRGHTDGASSAASPRDVGARVDPGDAPRGLARAALRADRRGGARSPVRRDLLARRRRADPPGGPAREQPGAGRAARARPRRALCGAARVRLRRVAAAVGGGGSRQPRGRDDAVGHLRPRAPRQLRHWRLVRGAGPHAVRGEHAGDARRHARASAARRRVLGGRVRRVPAQPPGGRGVARGAAVRRGGQVRAARPRSAARGGAGRARLDLRREPRRATDLGDVRLLPGPFPLRRALRGLRLRSRQPVGSRSRRGDGGRDRSVHPGGELRVRRTVRPAAARALAVARLLPSLVVVLQDGAGTRGAPPPWASRATARAPPVGWARSTPG
jgi:hypothetical protein